MNIEAPGLDQRSDRLAALCREGGPASQTCLATARATLPPQGAALTDVIGWLDTCLTLVDPAVNPSGLTGQLANDPTLQALADAFLAVGAGPLGAPDPAPGEDAVFDLEQESEGIQRLLSLLPPLLRMSQGAVVVIDDIGKGLHPMLVRKLMNTFSKRPLHAPVSC